MTTDPFSWITQNMPSDGVDQNEEMLAAQLEEDMRLARMVFEVFEGNPAGRELMALLDDLTIRAPLMQVSGSLVTGEVALSPSDWCFVREGQNSIVRWLQGQIHLAKKPPIPAETEGEE